MKPTLDPCNQPTLEEQRLGCPRISNIRGNQPLFCCSGAKSTHAEAIKALFAFLGLSRFFAGGTLAVIFNLHSSTAEPEQSPNPPGPDRMRINWRLPQPEKEGATHRNVPRERSQGSSSPQPPFEGEKRQAIESVLTKAIEVARGELRTRKLSARHENRNVTRVTSLEKV